MIKTNSKQFYASIIFLITLLDSKPINSTILSEKAEITTRDAKRVIKNVKDMLEALNLHLTFWYDKRDNNDHYMLLCPNSLGLLQNLTYYQLNNYLPYIVIIKLLFHQKVNLIELSKDNYTCKPKTLGTIIESLRTALIYLKGDYDIIWNQLFLTYELTEVKY